MAGGSYLEIIQGDSYVFTTDVSVDGVASNLSGSTLWFMAKNSWDDADSDAIINASNASGQITLSGNNSNVITVTLNSNYTQNLAQTNVAFWALRVATSGDNVYTLDRGRLAIVTGMPVDI